MRKTLLPLLLTLTLLLSLPVFAEASHAEPLLSALTERDGAADLQDWANGALVSRAGVGSEWFALALAQRGGADLSAYAAALADYAANATVPAATRQKLALCLAASGSTSYLIAEAAEADLQGSGVMAEIFRLHLLNNGYGKADAVAPAVASLLSLRTADGGWSVTGKAADPDVTAMALAALAPHRSETAVSNAIEIALARLSSLQEEDGTYSMYGVPNAESAAQVLLALCSLGIDAAEDTRFIKGGRTLPQVLDFYRLPGGLYAHTQGGAASDSANGQVLLALVAYDRLQAGLPSLYLLDHADPDGVEPPPATPDEPSDPPAAPEEPEQKEPLGYRLPACLAVAALGLVIALILFLKGKRHYKNYLALLLAVALLLTLILCTELRSPEEYYGGSLTVSDPVGSITLSVSCETVAGQAEHLPDDGVLLAPITVEFESGESLYSVFCRAARAKQLLLGWSGAGESAYLTSVNGLSEADFGSLSGWVYLVNGERLSVGMGGYLPQDGDVIRLVYSLELGHDVT